MTILHSGTTKKYSENWDSVFSGKGKAKAAKKAQPNKKSAKKAAASGKKRTAAKKHK